MKYLFALTLFISSSVIAQNTVNNDTDSLKKYSYFIFGITKPNYFGNGTGFFIRKENRLFFVTASHVCSGCNADLTRDKYWPDLLKIYLPDFIKPAFKPIGMPVPIKEYKDSHQCKLLSDTPDVFILEFPGITEKTFPYKIYSVEKFMLPGATNDVQIFGYPSNAKDEFGLSTNSIYIPDDKYTITALNANMNNWGKADSINYYIKTAFVKIDSSIKGYSGAPVFVKDIKSNQWRLLGLMVGNETNTKTNESRLIICKVQWILSELNKYVVSKDSKKGL